MGLRDRVLGWARPAWAAPTTLLSDWILEEDPGYDDQSWPTPGGFGRPAAGSVSPGGLCQARRTTTPVRRGWDLESPCADSAQPHDRRIT